MWLLIAAATVIYVQQTETHTHTHTFTLCNERREKETGETTTLRECVISYSNTQITEKYLQKTEYNTTRQKLCQ